MPDGTIEAVTTFSYMKYKFKLYELSSPIVDDLYFHRSPSVSALAAKVSRINKELMDWLDSIPPELRLENLCRDPNEPVTASTRPFMLQALALQVAYDNVQILLHRPLLSQDLRNFKSDSALSESNGEKYTLERSGPFNDSQRSAQDVHQILVSSRDHCWDSAIRSSRLGRYQQCLVSARESHAAAFLGINLFTAGMVLCVVALSQPLSGQAQMAKQGVSRIMVLSRFLSGKALLSAQTTKILRDLIRLIGEKEIKAMLSGPEVSGKETTSDRALPRPTEAAASLQETHRSTVNHKDQVENVATPQPPFEADYDYSTSGFRRDTGFADNFDFSGFDNVDFNNGIVTLQQAMFPASAVATPDANRFVNDGTARDPWSQDQYNAEHSYVNQFGGSEDGLMETDFNMMNSVGQTWLWDSASW